MLLYVVVRVQARALETEKELALTALSEAKEAELRRRLDDEMDSFKKAALVRHTHTHTQHTPTSPAGSSPVGTSILKLEKMPPTRGMTSDGPPDPS